MPALRTASRLILAANAQDRSDRPRPTAPTTRLRHRRAIRVPAVAILVAAGVAALPGLAHAHPATTRASTESPATTPASTASPAPYVVTQSTQVFVDTTRSTPARDPAPEISSRTLQTMILTPMGTTAPLPVVVFAHGYDSEPQTYLPLLQTWAAAGYLVVAPQSPGSAQDLPGAPVRTDIAEQARDLSFLITSLLGGAASAIDPSRISVAGHSDGGSAVALLALDPAYHDPRIGSYLVLSGAIPAGTNVGPAEPGRLLVVVGSDDEYGNLPASTEVFTSARVAKSLVVAHGGDHLDPYVASGTLADEVRATTVQFLDQEMITQVGGSQLTVSSSPQ